MDTRYERKFLVENLCVNEINNIVRFNQLNFQKVYENRFINNIYFDDVAMNNYRDNIEGNTNRKKVRIRWYGELKGKNEKPNLEIKIKKGEIGYKNKFLLNNFSVIEDFNSEYNKICENLKDLKKFHLVSSLRPTLVNRYQRSYFESFNKEFRLTIDQDLEYFTFFNNRISFFQRFQQKNTVIVELKYATQYSQNANIVSNQFTFRLSKSSKYIMGIDKIKPYFF